MFNKTNKTRPPEKVEAAPMPPLDVANIGAKKIMPIASSQRAASVIFSNLTIHGNITGNGDLHLDGTVHGDVKAGHLTVGETGNIEGKVEADTIEVRGRIVGTVIGKQIKLLATAYVEGDITHDQLSIDVGAYFQGRCLQTRKADAAPLNSSYNTGSHIAATPAPSSGPILGSYDLNSLADLK